MTGLISTKVGHAELIRSHARELNSAIRAANAAGLDVRVSVLSLQSLGSLMETVDVSCSLEL